jgi:hypothetical protein
LTVNKAAPEKETSPDHARQLLHRGK